MTNKLVFIGIIFCLMFSGINYAALTEDLVVYYTFDDYNSNGTILHDAKGQYDGSINGATTGSGGIIGNGFYFDGSNDYISLPTGAIITGNSPRTINFWLNTTDSAAYKCPFSVGTSALNQMVVFQIRSDNDMYRLAQYNNDWEIGKEANFTNYEMITLTFNGSSWSFYRNSINYANFSSPNTNTGSDYFLIGTMGTFTDYYLGSIDEFGMWEGVLSKEDIEYLYNEGNGTPFEEFPKNNLFVLRNKDSGENVTTANNNGNWIINKLTLDSDTNESIYASGSISAASFIDRTPYPDDGYDALSDIMLIKSDGNGNLDHNTLPAFAQKPYVRSFMTKPYQTKTFQQEICSKTTDNITKEVSMSCNNIPIIVREPVEPKHVTIKEQGRDLGGMISIHTVALQQMVDEITALKEELCQYNAKYSWCKAISYGYN
jgi:hypothetical protein